MRRLSLRSKVVLVSVGTGALVAFVLVWSFFVQAKEVMTDELRARGRTAAIGLSNLSYALSAGDISGLTSAQATLDRSRTWPTGGVGQAPAGRWWRPSSQSCG